MKESTSHQQTSQDKSGSIVPKYTDWDIWYSLFHDWWNCPHYVVEICRAGECPDGCRFCCFRCPSNNYCKLKRSWCKKK